MEAFNVFSFVVVTADHCWSGLRGWVGSLMALGHAGEDHLGMFRANLQI